MPSLRVMTDSLGRARLQFAKRSQYIVYADSPLVAKRHEFESDALVEVDMRLLGQRLQREAERAGVVFVGNCRVEGLDGHRLWTAEGVVRCDAIVDASGLAGLNLLGAPALDRSDVCVAAQEVQVAPNVAAQEVLVAVVLEVETTRKRWWIV